nr:putative RNA-dependent RNA polymerase [Binucleate Rhizoctonia mitovirus 11]
MKTRFIKQLSAFAMQIKERLIGMASVKSGRPLVRIINMMIPAVGLHTTSARVRAVVVFTRIVNDLVRKQGVKGACIHLKVCAVVLQQSIGGFIVKDITELKARVSRTNRGLPRIIPAQHRAEVLTNPALLRWYLTLFNLYRLFTFKGDYRLASLTKTIISPAKEMVGIQTLRFELLAFIPVFFKRLTRVIGMNENSLYRELIDSYENFVLGPILKSGPTTKPLQSLDWEGISQLEVDGLFDTHPFVSSHPFAVHEAAHKLAGNKELEPHFYFFMELVGNNSIREIFNRCLKTKLGVVSASTVALGKLSLKAEAAGKVRVFAMVDAWTQWLLKPLHEMIFNHILVGIPQDGTMNQLKPIHNLLERKPKSLYSLDLSAATDRLPLWLQEAILGFLTTKEYAHHWARFLVDRDYILNVPLSNSTGTRAYKVRYAVGQPMGAYSSWAMLALTHHFIVQYCAYKELGLSTWFTDYAILGDDVVIGDRKVARRYLYVMKTLGVGIGLHKSLISVTGSALEFAKRTFFNGIDVSPISFTELQAAMSQPAAAVAFIRKYNLSLSVFLSVAGYGYKVLGGLQRPLGKLNAKVRLIVLALSVPVTVEDIERFFSLGKSRAGRSLFETKAMITYLLSTEFKKLAVMLNALLYQAHSLELTQVRAKYMARLLFERQGPLAPGEGLEFKDILPLIREIMFQTQSHAKGVLIPSLHQLKAQLTKLMLSRYEMTAAQLLEGLIALMKSVGDLPLANLGYKRTLDIKTHGLSDTLHIRLWKVLSKYSQGTTPFPKGTYGIQDEDDMGDSTL